MCRRLWAERGTRLAPRSSSPWPIHPRKPRAAGRSRALAIPQALASMQEAGPQLHPCPCLSPKWSTGQPFRRRGRVVIPKFLPVHRAQITVVPCSAGIAVGQGNDLLRCLIEIPDLHPTRPLSLEFSACNRLTRLGVLATHAPLCQGTSRTCMSGELGSNHDTRVLDVHDMYQFSRMTRDKRTSKTAACGATYPHLALASMITGRKYSVPDPSHQPSQSDTCRWTGMLVNPLCSSKHSPDIVTDGGDQVWFLLYPLSSVPNKHLFSRRGID